MRTKLNEIEQKTISDSVNALMSLRRNRNVQITPSASGDSSHREDVDVSHHDSTDSLIVSKDYYDECDSSDDDSIKDANPLVLEIADNNDGGDNSAADDSVDQLTRDNVVVDNDESLSNLQSDVIKYSHRLPAGGRSTCITTVDCSSGIREDKDGSQPIIGVADNGVEPAEQLNKKCEHFIDSKNDAFANDAEVNNTEPSLEQYTDGRLSTNPMIERTENELVYAEMNCVNDKLNLEESEKHEKTIFDFNDDENSNQAFDNNVINNDHRNVAGSIEINNILKDNDSETCKNPHLNERQRFESLPLICSEQTINTSQILCSERLNTLETIDHDNSEDESSLTILTTCKSDRNEIKELPIQLPWQLPPQIKEEFYIKKSSEQNHH